MKFDLTYPSEQIKIVQRLGEKTSTDILVQVFNKGVPYNLAGMTLGFELRTDNNKIIIDKEQSRFTIVEPLKGVFSYRMHPNAQSFEGNAYIAYFTFEQGGARITTERFRVLNDEDVQNVCAPDIQQHYVSVIDDLVASNQSAMAEAQAIRDMINANRVVRKTGDTMTGSISFTDGQGVSFMDAADPSKRKAFISSGGNVTSLFDSLSGGRVWWYDHATQAFNVDKPTNLMKKTDYSGKDGEATLVLTADASNNNSNYQPMAYRRGNTVTVRLAVTRNVGSTNSLLTTLPINMRPPITLVNKLITPDGTSVDVEITSAGAVHMYTPGKSFTLVTTFAVNS
ncbi:phage baseplate upper protein [Bacillus cereus]|nr:MULTISPECIES: phage baseplate upper protein [Bacillus cereus group]MCU5278257.1 phage baseplate upper protein [Bacillus cereus]MEB9710421.1 phage baseplate upper protein [Bacillus cereus]MEB9734270.1 phage baseplate upper protein [Bacillus cereus]MEB9745452.1 phage baseplate upper protein [Bacillus cereus]MEC3274431.1 phage baseplate upper protein [Bacillus thuringiensis]